MISEKMREEFEVWASSPDFDLRAGHFVKGDDGEYLNYPTQCYFQVWQASRAAIEVELPEGLTLNEMRYGSKPKPDHERLLPRTTCIKAIESLGLKVKP